MSRGISLGEWIGTVHEQETEEKVLGHLLEAVRGSLMGFGKHVIVLRPERGSQLLAGWRAGLVEREESPDLLHEDDRAIPFEIDPESNADPDGTARVRSIRFAVEREVDISVDCLLDRKTTMGDADHPNWSPEWASRLAVSSVLVVAVVVAGRSRAVVAVTDMSATSPLRDELIRTIELLCRNAGLALERIAWRKRARRDKSHLGTVREEVRSIMRVPQLSSGLARLLRCACDLLEARGGTLWLVDRSTQGIYLAKTAQDQGDVDEDLIVSSLSTLAEDVIWRREHPLITDSATDPRVSDPSGSLGSIVATPIVALDQPLGAIILYGREEERQDRAAIFRRSDRELLEHFGLLAGVLSELTELTGRSSEAERLLEESRQDRMRMQSVADLGETSVKLAKEMSNPLASITGFARRVHRLIDEEDPNREYLEIIVREGERLERMVSEHLQFASLQRPRLNMCSLNHILQTTVKKFEDEIDPKQLRLLKKFSPQIPSLLLDEDRIQQAIENILVSAMDGVPKGGRLLIQSRRTKDHAVVEICHDGPPLSNDVLEQLFVPFGTGGRPGVGLGLGLAQRIVRDHGGEIGVQARGDWGHILALSLPLQDNEDRRNRQDRRLSGGRDRRNRFLLG